MKLLDKLRWDLRVASGAMGFTFLLGGSWKLGPACLDRKG